MSPAWSVDPGPPSTRISGWHGDPWEGIEDSEVRIVPLGDMGDVPAVDAHLRVDDDLLVRLRLVADEDGTLKVTETEQRRVDGGDLPATLVRRFAPGGAASTASKALRVEMVRLYLGEAWPKAPKRPGREGTDDLIYAQAAQGYVTALEESPRTPLKTLAGWRGESEQATRNLVYKARQRKLLTGAPPGKAGGELTEKARAVLAAVGVVG